MRRSILCFALLLSLSGVANATVIRFNTDPFAGSTALTTPGRQIVGGEPSVSFLIATDVFALERLIFGAGNQVLFVNDVVGNLPSSGVNIIVLQTLDNDNDTSTPFGAGNAASLIAARITTPGPGFFIYFNQGLNMPRLVFSTNLDDGTADLKILARMTNLVGQSAALPTFTAENFAMVPEPSSLLLLAGPGVLLAVGFTLRRRRAADSRFKPTFSR